MLCDILCVTVLLPVGTRMVKLSDCLSCFQLSHMKRQTNNAYFILKSLDKTCGYLYNVIRYYEVSYDYHA